MIVFLFSKMSRTHSFTSTDKEKNPPTPRSKIGHRRVDETGETTYKKASVKYFYIKYSQLDMHIAGEEIACGMDSYCLFWVKVIWSDTYKGHLNKVTKHRNEKEKARIKFLFQNLRQIFIWVLENTLWFVLKDQCIQIFLMQTRRYSRKYALSSVKTTVLYRSTTPKMVD